MSAPHCREQAPARRIAAPWHAVDRRDLSSEVPDPLEDVLVAYEPDDGERQYFVMIACRNLAGRWVMAGDVDPIDAYQRPVAWLRLCELPPLFRDAR